VYTFAPVKTLVIGVAGGSGSGKTTIARAIVEMLPPGACALLEHDCYYKDLAHLSFEQRAKVNFDHPDSLDNELFTAHIDALRAQRAIDKPQYDFTTHTRAKKSTRVEPAPVIVVEGILVLSDPQIRSRLDVKVFVDTDADIRVMRRIRRDIEHRGRTFAQVRQQYYETVRPMHLAFVEPSKRYADVIVPEGGENRVALELISAHLKAHLRSLEAGESLPAQSSLKK
jgi:uridine kinase